MAEIILSKNGSPVFRQTLAEGTYTIGRSTSCDIRVSDNDVSREHGKLTIEKAACTIEDLQSANGIHSEGKQVKKIRFKKEKTFQVGNHSLQVVLDSSRGHGQLTARGGGLLNVLARYPLPVLFFIQFIPFLLVMCVLASFLLQRAEDGYRATAIERAKLIALGSVPADFKQWSTAESIGLLPLTEYHGVRRHVITNSVGEVFYPAEERYSGQVDNPILISALTSKKLEIEWIDEDKDELRVCSPIKQNERLVGFSIIEYQLREFEPLGGKVVLLFVAILVIVALLSLLLCWFASTVFRVPLRALTRAGNVALEQRQTRVDFSGTGEELENLKMLVERLLMRLAREATVEGVAGASANSSSGKALGNVEKTGKGHDVSSPRQTVGKKGCLCVIDRSGGNVVEATAAFTELFSADIKSRSHVIEVFLDGGVMSVVQRLIDGEIHKAMCEYQGTVVTVTGELNPDNEQLITIRFIRDDDER